MLASLSLICYPTETDPPPLVPGHADRTWMDATGDQCLRLKKTLSPCSFSAMWNGGHRKDDLFVPIGTTGCGFLGPREVSCKPLDAVCFCCYRPSQSKLPILLGVEVAKSEQSFRQPPRSDLFCARPASASSAPARLHVGCAWDNLRLPPASSIVAMILSW
jgi:hypothetical protein